MRPQVKWVQAWWLLFLKYRARLPTENKEVKVGADAKDDRSSLSRSSGGEGTGMWPRLNHLDLKDFDL